MTESSTLDLIASALDQAEPRPRIDASRADKKNYAERLSKEIAQIFANNLRTEFNEILPDEHGKYHESKALSSRGPKKLDVNFSTPELGLGLGISIKTLNYPDQKSGRYTKNQTRIDNELRAEAMDYHQRQPYAVMAAVLFIPAHSVDDGKKSASSFAEITNTLARRNGRNYPTDAPDLFEKVFIGLYDYESVAGNKCVGFWNTETPPPRLGMNEHAQKQLMTFTDVLKEISNAFDRRNKLSNKYLDESSNTG